MFNGRQVVKTEVIDALAKGGSIEAFDNGPDSDGVVHPKGEWSYRAQWWVKHTPGAEGFMAIGSHGEWIYVDPSRDVAVVKMSSQPMSEGEVINGLDLNTFYAIVQHLAE
jgi:CubicO group peptidase (beta-lactamase class C family)